MGFEATGYLASLTEQRSIILRMNSMKGNIKFISLIKDTRLSTNMISLNNSFELLALFKSYGFRILNAVGFRGRGYANRLNLIRKFFTFLLYLTRKNGADFTVAFLKAGQLAIQKKIAGTPVASLRDINPSFPLPRTTNGFPYIIGVSDRRLMMQGKVTVIRFWLTLFSVYRIISIPANLSFSTITEPYNGCDEALARYSDLFGEVAKIWLKDFKSKFTESQFYLIHKASPTSKSSWMGYFYDIFLMKKYDLVLFQSLKDFLKVSHQSRLLTYLEYIEWLTEAKLQYFPKFLSNLKEAARHSLNNESVFFGQLSVKLEAAGKARVFAMVDYWSQLSLKGLHDMLFGILRQIPNDGTFDQYASIQRAAVKAKDYKQSFGYDLTAATDRLPLELQIGVLASFFSWDFAYKWADLLVYKRRYRYVESPISDGTDYIYSVGQPMGALSSWAMLAITHHLIVQLAFKLSYPLKSGWFEGYELLGDDIVIFDAQVASKYLSIMEEIGVPINLSKSVVATNETVEFAKVTLHEGVDCSALSWKQFLSTSHSLMGRVTIVDFLLRKSIGLNRFHHFLEGLLRKSRYDKGSLSPGYLALLTIMSNKGVFTLSWLIGYINNVKNPFLSWYSTILLSLDAVNLYSVLRQYWIDGVREFSLPFRLEILRDRKEVWIIMQLLKKLAMAKHTWSEYSFNQDKEALKMLSLMLPDVDLLPEKDLKDLHDFFTMGFVNKSLRRDLKDWYSLDLRHLRTLDDHVSALQLYKSIVAHFEPVRSDTDRKFDVESPLKVLTYIQDISKSLPDFAKRQMKRSD
nr:MAG: putative RNA dependent RNA polymerase [Yunnan mito-like virus 54]